MTNFVLVNNVYMHRFVQSHDMYFTRNSGTERGSFLACAFSMENSRKVTMFVDWAWVVCEEQGGHLVFICSDVYLCMCVQW